MANNINASAPLWWKASGVEIHSSVMNVYESLHEQDATRQESNRRFQAHYLNRFDFTSDDTVRTTREMNRNLLDKRKTLNLSKLVTDTARSRLAKIRPKPTLLVSGGDHSLRKQANLFEKALDGVIWNTGAYDMLPRLITDSQIYGKGVWHIYRAGEDIKLEQVHPNEILIDNDESQHQMPRTMLRYKLVSREILLDRFPDSKVAIQEAPVASDEQLEKLDLGSIDGSQDLSIADLVLVVEAWHLPSGVEQGDGRHVLVLENAAIFDEPYEFDKFPFVFLEWEPAVNGFWPCGLVENVVPYDWMANEILHRINTAVRRGTSPMVFVDEGSIMADQLSNEICNIYEVRNGSRDPRFVVPNAVSSDLYRHLDWLVMKAYETSGVNQLSAAGLRPAGVNAAVAMRELNDLQTERFLVQSLAIESVFVQMAELILDIFETYEDGQLPMVHVIDGHQMLQIDLKEINLVRDAFAVKMFPTNLLPETPAAKKSEVEELTQLGILTPEEILEMKVHPDIEKVYLRRTASTRAVNRIIERILEDGEYIAPESFFDDLPGAINRVRDSYFEAIVNDIPEERLSMLRRWVKEAEKILESAQQPAPTPAAPAAPDLTGNPAGLEGLAGGLPGVPVPPGV